MKICHCSILLCLPLVINRALMMLPPPPEWQCIVRGIVLDSWPWQRLSLVSALQFTPAWFPSPAPYIHQHKRPINVSAICQHFLNTAHKSHQGDQLIHKHCIKASQLETCFGQFGTKVNLWASIWVDRMGEIAGSCWKIQEQKQDRTCFILDWTTFWKGKWVSTTE